MIVATLVHQISFPGIDNICLYRFSVPSIGASSISDDIQFALNTPAKFENIRVSCASTNYDFSIRLESGITLPSLEEIYRAVNLNRTFSDDLIEVWWGKPTGADMNNLYGVITNSSGTATGEVTFEFILRCF